jgi:hypothetical protein
MAPTNHEAMNLAETIAESFHEKKKETRNSIGNT